MSISAGAVIVELNISVWTANKLDKSATADLISQNSAATDAARVRKNLLAGTHLRKAIADHAAACRTWHTTNTLPWSDKGPRLLPTSLFMEYKTGFNNRKQFFDDKVEEFVREYPNLVQVAQNYLGGLYNPEDYPAPEEIAQKFSFKITFSPVPESGDFRLDVAARDLEELRQEYEVNFQHRIADAMREPWDRLYKLISGMSTKLEDAPAEEKRRYHDSFLTNAQDLVELLKALNITDDPKLDQARRDLAVTIRGVTMDSVKEDPSVRRNMKRSLDTILKTYDW